MGKISKAITDGRSSETDFNQFSETETITRRPEENRDGSKSKMGARKGSAKEESCLIKVRCARARNRSANPAVADAVIVLGLDYSFTTV
jgi:hypothetical protein